jgi:hypothetical protein
VALLPPMLARSPLARITGGPQPICVRYENFHQRRDDARTVIVRQPGVPPKDFLICDPAAPALI